MKGEKLGKENALLNHHLAPQDCGYSFDEYERATWPNAQYPEQGSNAIYPTLGLIGEAGEVAEKIKKLWRNDGKRQPQDYDDKDRECLAKELGDVLWYLSAVARECGFTLQEIALINALKLKDRNARGVIRSEGDER